MRRVGGGRRGIVLGMSTNNANDDPAAGESESMHAARNAPPLPHERGRDRVEEPGDGVSSALPLILSLGGAVAAAALGMAAERGATSDAARRARDEGESWLGSAKETAEDWGESLLSTGAKAAGVAGLLKALGGGNLSSAASTAAKAVAAKKIAEAFAGGAKSAGKAAVHHPALSAAGLAGLLKARSAAHETGGRVRDAGRVLRHGRESVQDRGSSAMSSAATGLALLGIGAAALYLFDPDRGRHRRRVLRERVVGAGRAAWEQVPEMPDVPGVTGGEEKPKE